MRWDAEASPAGNAGTALPKMARQWFERGLRASGTAVRHKDLHAFRLETKHFRYTLELFRPVYGPGLVRLLELLKSLQASLGDLNDCVIAGAYITEAIANAGERRIVKRRLAARALRQRAKFRRLWKDAFGAPHARERWIRYLSRPREARAE
jgi:CHAD domain-containing protein